MFYFEEKKEENMTDSFFNLQQIASFRKDPNHKLFIGLLAKLIRILPRIHSNGPFSMTLSNISSESLSFNLIIIDSTASEIVLIV
jgi:hypothetical protein